MMPLPTVLATAVPIMAPMTFIVAAMRSAARGVHARVDTEVMRSAARGVHARVDTEVAIAFAASWKPLV